MVLVVNKNKHENKKITQTYGRTDILKIIVTIRSFWNALKIYTDIYVIIAEYVQTLEVVTVKPAQKSIDTSSNYARVKEQILCSSLF